MFFGIQYPRYICSISIHLSYLSSFLFSNFLQSHAPYLLHYIMISTFYFMHYSLFLLHYFPFSHSFNLHYFPFPNFTHSNFLIFSLLLYILSFPLTPHSLILHFQIYISHTLNFISPTHSHILHSCI